MRMIRTLLLRLMGLFNKEQKDRNFIDELECHLQMEIEDNLHSGMTLAEARRAALIRSGGLEAAKESYRDRRGLPILERLLQDFRYAFRSLLKSPGFTLTALVTLGIGIGANTAIFSTINAVLLRQLPYPDSGRLVMLWTDDRKHDVHQEGVSYPNFVDWRRMNHTFEDMAILSRAVSAILSGGQEPENVQVAVVSPNLFSVLGVNPVIGRLFSAEEIQNGNRVIVISYGLWIRRFGGSPSAIGSTLEIDGIPWRIAGVMPASFQFPDSQVPLWEPVSSFRGWPGLQRERYSDWGRVIGRLKPHVTLAQAQAEMDAIGKRLKHSYQPSGRDAAAFAGFSVNLVPLLSQITGTQLPLALWVLMAGVLFVLLIACVNVANLLIARGSARSHEIAVRQALGASRGRIVQQLLTESLLLAGTGGALGFGIAAAGVRLLISRGPRSLPRLDEIRIDPLALAFTVAVSLLAGMLFGIIPALRSSQTGSALKQRIPAAGSSGVRIRGVLVIIEIALSVILLSSAGILIHSFLRIQSIDSGFNHGQVLTMRISSSRSGEAVSAFYREILQRIDSLPGVRASGIVEDVLQRRNPDYEFMVAGRAAQPTEPISGDAASPGYFDALGVRLLRGRPFQDSDGPSSARVAIVNETMARHLWPGEDAIGRQLRAAGAMPNDPSYTIVGIVSDMRREGLEREPIAQIFWPQLQRPVAAMDLVVRTVTAPAALASAIREQIRSVDSRAAVFHVSTLDDRLDESLAPRRFQSSLLAMLAAIGLGLAAVGIYGVMHYSVTLRTAEIGIRMALGAPAGNVVGMVVRQGLTMAVAGLILGVAGALAITGIFSRLLFGVTPTDPATFTTVIGLIGAVTVLACCIPARRAVRIDPLSALRHE
jgi:predicted permease